MREITAVTIPEGWAANAIVAKFSIPTKSYAFKPQDPFDFVFHCRTYPKLHNNEPLGRINLVSHGSPTGFQIGSHWVSNKNIGDYTGHFATVREVLTGQSFVHIQGCSVGQNDELLKKMAAAFGVPVYAGEGYENVLYGLNTGDIKVAYPSGTVATAQRPDTPDDDDHTPVELGSYQSS